MKKKEVDMKKKKIFAISIIGVLGISTAFFLGVFKKPLSSDLILYGNVDIREVDLGFRVFGRVKAVFFDEGDAVKPGDLLAELDPIPYEEAVWKAKAQVELLEASFTNSQKKFARRQVAVTSLAVSEEDFEDSFANAQEMKAGLDSAKASLAEAKTNLEDTKLFAPSEGILLSRIREVGSVLEPGQPVFSMALKEPIWVRAYVSEPDLGRIFYGMKARVFTDTTSHPTYEGYVGFISPVAEFTPKNVETTDLRTALVYRIRVIIPKPDAGLKQGMPVTLQVYSKPSLQEGG